MDLTGLSRRVRSLWESCKIEPLEKTIRHETIHSISYFRFVIKRLWTSGSRGAWTGYAYRSSHCDCELCQTNENFHANPDSDSGPADS